MAAELGLSVAAQRCRDARLPELLRAVRRRGERRRRRRAAVAFFVGGLLLVLVGAWWPSSERASGGRPPRSPDDAAPVAGPVTGPVASSQAVVVAGSNIAMATVVRDDPAVVARHAVATKVQGTWFVDDAGLQALLRADGRADGLVRIDGRVLVRAAAIDPYDAP